MLKFIDDRLGELETEKQELTEYEKLDTLRRALEYSLHDKELAKANVHLAEVEVARTNTLNEQNDLYNSLNEVQQDMQSKESNYLLVKSQVDRLVEKRGEKVASLNQAIGKLSALSVEYNEYLTSAGTNQQEYDSVHTKMKEIEKKITLTKKRMTAMEPAHAEKLEMFQNANREYVRVMQRMEHLYGKQGRNKQFHSKKERDSYLRQQIEIQKSQHDQKLKMIEQLQLEKQQDLAKNKKEIDELAKFQTELNNRSKRKEELTVSIQAGEKQRDKLQDQRKKLWAEQELIVEQLNEVKSNIAKSRQLLNASLPKVMAQGLDVVELIAMEKGLKGYFGPVIDIINISADAFRIPIEVAAGNALFHIVVDDDNTASILMLELERRKSGRLTFLPLERIQQNYSAAIDYPKHPDVHLLMKVAMTYDVRFEAAIRHVSFILVTYLYRNG